MGPPIVTEERKDESLAPRGGPSKARLGPKRSR